MMTKAKAIQANTAQEALEAARAAYDAAEVEIVDRQHEEHQIDDELARLHTMPSGNRTAMGNWQERVSELKQRKHQLGAELKPARAALTLAAGELHAAEHAAQRESEAIHATE
jgi:chromosome segregation ATPase